MPRASAQTQFERYQLLNDSYFGDDEPFGYLSPVAQQEIFRFYQPHEDGHTVETLRAHQARLSQAEPSLSSRAGKQYKQFVQLIRILKDRERERARRHSLDPKPKRIPLSERSISVRSVLRPEIDMRKLARGLAMLVEYNEKQKHNQ